MIDDYSAGQGMSAKCVRVKANERMKILNVKERLGERKSNNKKGQKYERKRESKSAHREYFYQIFKFVDFCRNNK